MKTRTAHVPALRKPLHGQRGVWAPRVGLWPPEGRDSQGEGEGNPDGRGSRLEVEGGQGPAETARGKGGR